MAAPAAATNSAARTAYGIMRWILPYDCESAKPAKRARKTRLSPFCSSRLRRLAVALAYQGRKLGGALLWDAIERASRSEMAVYALVVDAKDEPAESFYLHHGFVAFGDAPRAFILPLPKRT